MNIYNFKKDDKQAICSEEQIIGKIGNSTIFADGYDITISNPAFGVKVYDEQSKNLKEFIFDLIHQTKSEVEESNARTEA